MLKIAIESNSMRPPRSGIGRYTWEITRRWEQDPGLGLFYFYGMSWVTRWPDIMPPAIRSSSQGMVRWLKEYTPRGRELRHQLDNAAFHIHLLRHPVDVVFGPNYSAPKSHVPTMITLHDLSHIHYPETHPPARVAYLNQQIPKSLYQAAIILTDSEFSRQEIVDAFPEVESRIRVVYPGINPSVANAGADTDLVQWLGTDPPPYFLFLATLEPRKNISRLLEAYATLPDRFRKEHPLYLAGNFGWREAEFSDVLKRLVEGGEARILGFVPDTLLPALYHRALALVYPSIYEGFGLPPVEAMATGCPVLVSNVTAMPEVCGDAALYCDPLDVSSIRDGMLRLAEDVELRNRLSQAGPVRASLYSWDQSGTEVLALLREIAKD
ncbi:glycosyltransferase family 4 protein [Acidithiobacillus ferriphilus]|nr:glycosyltransferase family 4 protein [Acidithiobacillus ferriphilus]